MTKLSKGLLTTAVSVLALGAVGCSDVSNQDVGTVTGAVAGGLLGSTIGGGTGQVAATVGGAVVGGVIGNRVGASMDE